MKRKDFSLTGPVALGLRALLMGAMGYLTLARPAFVKGSLTLILIAALVLNGLATLAAALKGIGSWVSGVISLLLAGVLSLWPGVLAVGTSLAYGLWMLLNAVIQLGFAFQLFVTRSRGKWRYVSIGLISLLLGLEVVFHPVAGAEAADMLAGVYFLLFALWLLADMAAVLLHKNVESSPFMSWLRVKPPVVLTALLPSRALKKIRAQAAQATADAVTAKPVRPGKTYAAELQVVFHLGEAVAFGFGHTDIQYGGVAYSYGCYDAASNKLLGAISDGVFMTAPGEPYLDYCRRYEGKSLVGYFIGLTADAARRIETALSKTIDSCKPWVPAPVDPLQEGTPRHCALTIGSRYRKVEAGPFRYYNVFKTNCAAMAEILANESGVHLLPPRGAVTPGGYFAFLEKELADPASDVLRRIVYHPLCRSFVAGKA